MVYMPCEGYNSDIFIRERLVYGDTYNSFHIRKYKIKTHVTSQDLEKITKEIFILLFNLIDMIMKFH